MKAMVPDWEAFGLYRKVAGEIVWGSRGYIDDKDGDGITEPHPYILDLWIGDYQHQFRFYDISDGFEPDEAHSYTYSHHRRSCNTWPPPGAEGNFDAFDLLQWDWDFHINQSGWSLRWEGEEGVVESEQCSCLR